MKNSITFTVSFLLLNLIWVVVRAQKLPATQKEGLRAPVHIKIDGKATEWGQYKAYNKSTEVFYSIANDDDNLYLVVQAVKSVIISNIIRGGITFTINHGIGKKDKNAVSVIYPVLNRVDRSAIGYFLIKRRDKITDTVAMQKHTDSVMYALNKQIGSRSKQIMVTGVSGIDSVISVYNLDGIKAAALFNHKLAYTYELAIPLKYLGLTADSKTPFSYNIKVNYTPPNVSGINIKDVKSISISGNTATISGPGMGNIEVDMLSGGYTDFWGEYTLVLSR
jgi:hypothetical protein